MVCDGKVGRLGLTTSRAQDHLQVAKCIAKVSMAVLGVGFQLQLGGQVITRLHTVLKR